MMAYPTCYMLHQSSNYNFGGKPRLRLYAKFSLTEMSVITFLMFHHPCDKILNLPELQTRELNYLLESIQICRKNIQISCFLNCFQTCYTVLLGEEASEEATE